MTALAFGDVKVTLADEQHTLACTLGAAMSVDAAFGNYSEAANCLQNRKLSAYMQIVAAGLNVPFEKAQDLVFRTGMPSLIEPVSEYLLKLANGGRPISEVKDGAPGEV